MEGQSHARALGWEGFLCPIVPGDQALPQDRDSGRWMSPHALGLLTRERRAMVKASSSWDHHLGLLGDMLTSYLVVSQRWVQQQPERGEALMLERTLGI